MGQKSGHCHAADPRAGAASLWGRDVKRVCEVAALLACGTIWVNQHIAMVPSILFRRAKQSGLGKEPGLERAVEVCAGLAANALRAPSTEAGI